VGRYDVAHLCDACGDHWTTWGRDRETKYEGDSKRRRVALNIDEITADDIQAALGEMADPTPEQTSAAEARTSLAQLDAG
jgi:hypothetical protein